MKYTIQNIREDGYAFLDEMGHTIIIVYGKKKRNILKKYMEEKKLNILLDMDGVLVDFVEGALIPINKKYGTNITVEQYAKEYGEWWFNRYFNITIEEVYREIGKIDRFWYNLKPIPWAKELYQWLSEIGDVTILTAPNRDLDCATEKMKWLRDNLGINPKQVMVGSRKHLLAGNGILIDDYIDNCKGFEKAGGKAINIPSTWNTAGLTFEDVKNVIEKDLK